MVPVSPDGPVPGRRAGLAPGRGEGRARKRRVSLFVQEPFGTAGLRAGVICDGTTRGGPNGLAQGALRVVECAELCAARGDVALFAAFILSPQNVVRRAMPFFAALHAEFLRLLEGVAAGRALRGIRVEVEGRLDRLRNKGAAAARLANAIALLVDRTASAPDSATRLVLGVDYGEDAPVALGLDVLVRTGMEEANVLRLSGLRVQKSTICIPMPTLWRDFTAADLGRVLSLGAQHARSEPAGGFSGAFVIDLAAEIGRADLPGPLRILLPVAAGAPGTLAGLGGARARLPQDVTVTAAAGPGGAPMRIGPKRARVEIHLLDGPEGPWPADAEPVAWIVPGQAPPVLRLLDRSARDANIHVCEATPRGLLHGVREALRFQAAHPPLHGAPRARPAAESPAADRVETLMRHVAARPGRSAEEIAIELSNGEGVSAALVGDVFAARCLVELGSSGLVSGEVDWRQQAFGYALTAFGIAYPGAGAGAAANGGAPLPSPAETAIWEGQTRGARLGVGNSWEPAARELARAMLVMASSDEEISDRVFEGEDAEAHRARLAASVEHLAAVVRGEVSALPAVRGAPVLGAIAGYWRAFFEDRARTAHPVIVEAGRRAVEGLYRANLEELSRADPALSSVLRASRAHRVAAIEERLTRGAAEPIARRLRELIRAVVRGDPDPEAVRELRLLCRLRRAAPSIGAGCAFLVMAATEPSAAVPDTGAAALLRALPLIDHGFRLANDLAFTDATRGDRDDKPNAFTCLVPSGLTGKPREQASADALFTCRSTAAWLDAEIDAAAAEVAREWPAAGAWLARGVHIGRRAYQSSHYARLTPSAIAGIVAEVDGGADPGVRSCPVIRE